MEAKTQKRVQLDRRRVLGLDFDDHLLRLTYCEAKTLLRGLSRCLTAQDRYRQLIRRTRMDNLSNIHPRNILTLPTDVLWAFCKLVCADAADFEVQNLENFQLVCGAFRRVAISVRELWSCVDDNMSVARIELQLLRSGHVGLSIRINFENDPRPVLCKCPRWELMKFHHLRWTRAILTLSTDDHDWDAEHYCIWTLQNMNLPNLVSLSSNFYDAYREVKEFAWMTPSLRSLTCNSESDFDFLLLLEDVCLTDLKVVLDSAGLIYTDKMLEFLTKPSVSSITALTFDFKWSGIIILGQEDDIDANVPLSHLETLVVIETGKYNYRDFGLLETVLHVEMPNLKRLHLRVGWRIYGDDRFFGWMGSLANPSLEMVDVFFFVYEGDDASEDIRRRTLECFPQARPEPEIKITFEYLSEDCNSDLSDR